MASFSTHFNSFKDIANLGTEMEDISMQEPLVCGFAYE